MNRADGRTAPVAVLRLLLLAVVLAGIVAMHVLGGHESMTGGAPMAMATSIAAPSPASDHVHSMSAAAGMPVMPSMSSSSGMSGTRDDTEPGNGTSVWASPGGMTHTNTCCLLFLAAVGLLLLTLLAIARLRNAAAGPSEPSTVARQVRGPPGAGPPRISPPRISLCVLRV